MEDTSPYRGRNSSCADCRQRGETDQRVANLERLYQKRLRHLTSGRMALLTALAWVLAFSTLLLLCTLWTAQAFNIEEGEVVFWRALAVVGDIAAGLGVLICLAAWADGGASYNLQGKMLRSLLKGEELDCPNCKGGGACPECSGHGRKTS